MKEIINKLIDYHLNKRLIDKTILIFIIAGIALISQSILDQIFEEWLKIEYGIQLPDLKFYGIGLILIGLLMLAIDIKYTFLPSMFHTQKTTKIISLGNNRFQFIFEKKMRCTPTICFIKPSYTENKFHILKWDNNGFIIEFEKNKPIEELDFWADAWDGLNYRQKLYLFLINLFRKKNNQLKKHEYSDGFANRQIQKLNNT
jgi:hypothetical protein